MRNFPLRKNPRTEFPPPCTPVPTPVPMPCPCPVPVPMPNAYARTANPTPPQHTDDPRHPRPPEACRRPPDFPQPVPLLPQLLGSARVTDYAHHPPEMVRAYKRKLKTTWRTCPPPRHRGVWPGAYVGASRAVDTTWTQVLEDLQDVDRTNIAQRLARREWDVVVYALADRSAPYLDVVQRHYPPSRVALVLGNDLPEGDLAKVAGFAATGYVFQREMYDGALDGPHRNATICIPSATKCLVPPSPEPLPISRGPVYAPRE